MTQEFCDCSLFTSSFAEGDYYFFGPEGKNSFLVICFKWLSSYGEIIMLIILKSVLWRGGKRSHPVKWAVSVKAGYAQAVTAITTYPFPVQKRSSRGSRENPPATATAQGHLPAPLPGPAAGPRATQSCCVPEQAARSSRVRTFAPKTHWKHHEHTMCRCVHTLSSFTHLDVQLKGPAPQFQRQPLQCSEPKQEPPPPVYH